MKKLSYRLLKSLKITICIKFRGSYKISMKQFKANDELLKKQFYVEEIVLFNIIVIIQGINMIQIPRFVTYLSIFLIECIYFC